jgi:hypothetical protein
VNGQRVLQNLPEPGALPTAMPCARLHIRHVLWEAVTDCPGARRLPRGLASCLRQGRLSALGAKAPALLGSLARSRALIDGTRGSRLRRSSPYTVSTPRLALTNHAVYELVTNVASGQPKNGRRHCRDLPARNRTSRRKPTARPRFHQLTSIYALPSGTGIARTLR